MKLRPLEDRVVVEPAEAEEKTAGGIVLPEAAKEKPMMGKILAIGPGKVLENGKHAEMSVKKNDKIIYGRYAGSDFEIDGKNLKILREGEILGVVEK